MVVRVITNSHWVDPHSMRSNDLCSLLSALANMFGISAQRLQYTQRRAESSNPPDANQLPEEEGEEGGVAETTEATEATETTAAGGDPSSPSSRQYPAVDFIQRFVPKP